MNPFDGAVAVVTGSASGIGRALAVELASRGARLALGDIRAEGLEETAALTGADRDRVLARVLDVADRSALESFAADTMAQFGSVNYLFNNAGVALISRFEHADASDFSWLMDINFWGVVNGTRAFLPYMQRSGSAHIVNLSSLFGIMGAPGQTAYCAAKFAVRGFSEALSAELADSPIRVSCVHPGGIDTKIVRHSRVRDPEPNAVREEALQKFEKLAITSPESAARKILSGVVRGRRRILVGRDARIADFVVRLLPGTYGRILGLGGGRLMRRR